MNMAERLKYILETEHITQREFAENIGVTQSYISAIVNGKTAALSIPVAKAIENVYGFNSDWVLENIEPVRKYINKAPGLSGLQKKIMEEVDNLSEEEAENALFFLKLISDKNKQLKVEIKPEKNVLDLSCFSKQDKEKIEEYSKFLEWQNEQKNKNKK